MSGSTFEQLGRAGEAEQMSVMSTKARSEMLGEEHAQTRSNMEMAGRARALGTKYDELEAMNRQTLAQREKMLGPEHPDTLASMNNLAAVLNWQGKYEEAETLNRHALARYEKVLGEHPDTLTSMNNLAQVLYNRGKYKEAEMMSRQTLARKEKVLGHEHPDTITSINNLALVLNRQGKYEEAEMMNRQTLAQREKVLGRKHPDTLMSMNNLAAVINRQGKYEEAEALNRQTLARYKEVLGPEHPDTLMSMNNLSAVLNRRGKYEEAETLNRYTLARYEEMLGREHPDTLTSMNNLAQVLYNRGKYKEAEMMSRQTLARKEKVLGHEHPDTITTVYWLAYLLTTRYLYKESIALYVRACAGYETMLGKDHPTTLACYQHYVDALLLQGQDQFIILPTVLDGSLNTRTRRRQRSILPHELAKIARQQSALKSVRISSTRGGLSEVDNESTCNDVLDHSEQRGLPHDKHEEQQVRGVASTRDNTVIHYEQRHRDVVSPLDLPEMMRDNLEYREVYGSGPVWTYTSSEDVSIDSIPLRISGHPVVVPIKYRHPAAAYTIPPPDPRHLFIDASKGVSEDIVNDIFETYNDILGFYLLINGMLQLIIPEDFDIENALSHKPNEFGSLKVSYIHQSIIPTAESQEGTFSGSLQEPPNVEAATSQHTRPSYPLQVCDNTSTSSEHGKSRDGSMDLKIGSMVHACMIGLKAVNRFQGKIGLMTESNGQNHMVIPTHILTQALMATKSDRFPGDQWKDDIVVVASSGGREIGHVTKTFDPLARGFPQGFEHDVSLVEIPQRSKHLGVSMKSSLPTEWLSQDGWNNVKYTSQSLFLLDKPDLQAKNIALMTSQYQMVGQAVFKVIESTEQKTRFRFSLKGKKVESETSAEVWTGTVARSVLYRVNSSSMPPGALSGTAVCIREELEDGTSCAKVAGFSSWAQPAAYTSFDMDGPKLYSRLEDGRVAFFGAFQAPPELRENHRIV